ncbi:PREDICTED: putative uncharacterized protein [Galeopterus variegatus]|uniref:Small integral membrane protein 34A n=1 Tax=Galeopterus variegatus TaxID=482537 RepID=A0ABM0QDV4_GALVR|nr:PREDICTED: putative uncharacterized protein [Galeopterus variegatus]
MGKLSKRKLVTLDHGVSWPYDNGPLPHLQQVQNRGIQEPFRLSAVIEWTLQEASNETQARPLLGHLLSDHTEGRNGTNPTRALKLPDGTSAAWYILTILGIYGVIFLFRLASNILRKNDKSLEDMYYSNLTFELKKKGLQSKAAKCSTLTISNRAVLQPNQASPGPKCGHSGPHAGTQGIP